MQGNDDAGLLARAAQGNAEAFLKLFETHYRAMYRFAYRLTGVVDVAEDLTQECFVRLIRDSKFDPERGSLRQFLYGMIRNIARERQRASGREVNWAHIAGSDHEVAVRPVDATFAADIGAAVQAALSALPPLQREAIVLCEFEDLSLAEAALIAHTDVGTLKARIYRARDGLRRRLAPFRAYAGLSSGQKR